jgi:hypothetical protein
MLWTWTRPLAAESVHYILTKAIPFYKYQRHNASLETRLGK